MGLAQLPVIKTIGPVPSDFLSITAAITAMQSSGITTPTVWELKPNYVSTIETFPLTFPGFTGASDTISLTIRPAIGATGRTISGSNSTAIINLNGARNVIFDGRPGGLGTKDLIIANTNTGGPVIRFINDACNNTFRFCTIKGVTSSLTSGVVVYGSTTGTSGNDNNLIDHSDLCNGVSNPTNLIYSSGTTTFPGNSNSNNIISNCNLYNWHQYSNNSNAIDLEAGTTGWKIKRNSFFQTASLNLNSSATITALNIASGGGYAIDSNYVGGDSPNALVAFIPMTYTGAGIMQFFKITPDLFSLTTIEGNVFRNISFTTSNTSPLHSYLDVRFGNVDIGTITGNQIGNQNSTGSLVFSTSGNGAKLNGILIENGQYSDTLMIQNNTIGSINLAGSGYAEFRGLTINAFLDYTSLVYVKNNIIGSPTVTNSISNATKGGFTGIYAENYGSSNSHIEICNNQITHVTITSTATAANNGMFGLKVISSIGGIGYSCVYNIHHNLLEVMSSASPDYIYGMYFSIADPGQIVSKNEIRSLISSFLTSSSVEVCGIRAGIGNGTISGNIVHNLKISTGNKAAKLYGIIAGSGIAGSANNYINNMIQLGIDDAGNDLSTGYTMYGIYENGGPNNFYFNSVYIGGTVSAISTYNTYAFYSQVTSYIRNFRNNIFCNSRSGGNSCYHYAIRMNGTGSYPTGLSSNHNLFYANGSLGVLGYYGSNKTTLAEWRTATGQDWNSVYGNPNFINPAGSASTMNLHIQSPTPVEQTGIFVTGFDFDYDGQNRNTLTPADIGADAGLFIATADQVAPDISFTPLPTGLTSNRTVSGFATITDNTGVAGSPNRPRLYYKRSTDPSGFIGNLPTNPGWKYAIATNSTSPFSFVIDYSILFGGSVADGSTIEYFVVAQDDANNLSSSPSGVTASANPPVQFINGTPSTLLTYIVTSATLSGTINIPGDFASITSYNGFFNALANRVVTGNLTVKITGDLYSEFGQCKLEPLAEEPLGSNYTIKFVPSNASEKIISFPPNGDLVNLLEVNGAKNVTIDGRFNGSGKYLHFKTDNFSYSSVIAMNSNSSNVTLRNCIIEAYSASSGYSAISMNGNNNTITECVIRDLSNGTGVPYNLIYCAGGNDCFNNTITNNEMFNFRNCGIDVTGNGTGGGWNISGNSIYQTMAPAPTTSQTGISFKPGPTSGNNIISDNWIGGSAVQCGGGYWINNGSSGSVIGISASVGTTLATSMQNNTIRSFYLSNIGYQTFTGINLLSGQYNAGTVTGNTVGHPSSEYNIISDGTGWIIGVRFNACGSIMNSLIANIVQTAANPGTFYGIDVASENAIPINVNKNKIINCGPDFGSTGTNEVDGIIFYGGHSNVITISNNMVSLGHGFANSNPYVGIQRTAYFDNCRTYYYYNSVYIGGTGTGSSNSYAFQNSNQSFSHLKNNVFHNARTGGTGKHYSIGVIYSTGVFLSDYNDLYNLTVPLGIWGTTNLGDLGAWKAATGMDINSVNTLPNFASTTDLHITDCIALNNKGINIPTVTTDFDGNQRGNPPDPGINEFTADKAWNGTISTNWNDPANWTPAGVPTNLHDVIINPALHNAVISIPNLKCHNLLINQDGNLIVNPGTNFTVEGECTIH